MPRPLKILREPNLLLVEGDDDANFITALFAARGVTSLQVEKTQGKSGLRDDLIAWTFADRFSHVEWLGIIQDGDEDPPARFASICANLRNRKLPAPSAPWRSADGRPRTLAGVITDPDYGNDLEGLVLRSLSDSGDPWIPCVDQYLECVAQTGLNLPRQLSKGRLRTWLAMQEPPTLPLGFAAQRGLIPLTHSAFDQLADILNL